MLPISSDAPLRMSHYRSTLLLLIRPILAKEADYETRSTPHLPFAGVFLFLYLLWPRLSCWRCSTMKASRPAGASRRNRDYGHRSRSTDFGKILMEVPLPPDLVAHHIFLQSRPDQGLHHGAEQSVLHAVDLTRFPYRLRPIEVPECQVLEDLVVSEDNRIWFLTCMGSSTVIMGDAVTDKPTKVVRTNEGALVSVRYPHGMRFTTDQPRVDHQHGQARHVRGG